MQSGRKSVFRCERVYLLIFILWLIPVIAVAGMHLEFEWNPNPGKDTVGYRLYVRQPGDDFNYDEPAWEGKENYCSVYIDDDEDIYLFTVRAFDEEGFESGDSNEVVFPDDLRYLAGNSSASSSGGCFIDILS